MTQGISNISPIQNTAVAAVAIEPNKTKEAINDKVAVANVKNAKENSIKDKEKESKNSQHQDGSGKEESRNGKSLKSSLLANQVLPNDFTYDQNAEMFENLNKYKKAKEIYEPEGEQHK